MELILIQNLASKYLERLQEQADNPTEEFKKWKTDSKVVDIIPRGPKVFLQVQDISKVDREEFDRLLLLKDKEVYAEDERVITEFILDLKIDGKPFLQSTPFDQLVQDLNKALANEQAKIQFSDKLVDQLIQRSCVQECGFFNYLFHFQNEAPRVLAFLDIVLQSRHAGSPLQIVVAVCLENRAALIQFFSLMTMNGTSIQEGRPVDVDPLQWANQLFATPLTSIRCDRLDPVLERLNDPFSMMPVYLETAFKVRFPRLYTFLVDQFKEQSVFIIHQK